MHTGRLVIGVFDDDTRADILETQDQPTKPRWSPLVR
jgi:hypothetical protein